MKNIGLLLAVVFVLLNDSCKQKTFLRIAFYNLENLYDTLNDPKTLDDDFTPNGKYAWNNERYEQKLKNLSRVIDEVKPDILGVCEVENKRVLRDLTLKTQNKGYKIAHHESPDERGIDIALIYDRKIFRQLDQEAIRVDLSAFNDRTRDILLVTGILYGKDTAGFYLCHWPSRGGGREQSEPKRLLAAKALKNHLFSTAKNHPDWKLVVMGDFNDEPDDISIRDVLEASDHLRSGTLYNPFVQARRDGNGSLKHQGSWDMFDQIMYLPGTQNEPWMLDFGIFKPDWLLQQEGDYAGYPHRNFGGSKWLNGYSDHLPVYMDFKVTGKK